MPTFQPRSAQLVVHHQSCPASRINAITCSGSADHASPAAMALPARLPAEPRSGRNQGLNHVVAILLGNEYHLQLGVPSGSNLVPEHALARCGSFFVASERVVRGHLATGVPNLDGLASTSGAAILKPKSSNPLPRRTALKATEAKRRRCDAGSEGSVEQIRSVGSGGRAHLMALLLLGISRVVDVRDPIQRAYDRISTVPSFNFLSG
jgi:hypothetical protein